MSKHISQRTYTTTLNEGVPFLKALRLTDWEVNYGSYHVTDNSSLYFKGKKFELIKAVKCTMNTNYLGNVILNFCPVMLQAFKFLVGFHWLIGLFPSSYLHPVYLQQSTCIRDSDMLVVTQLFQQAFCLFLLKRGSVRKID